MRTVYVTAAQVSAAKGLMVLDQAEHRQSDDWTIQVANAVEEEGNRPARFRVTLDDRDEHRV